MSVFEGKPGYNPFGDLIGMKLHGGKDGRSRSELTVAEIHFNPHGVIHGGVIYSLADTCMGSALYSLMTPEEICSTIEIKINYTRPVTEGLVICETEVVHRGRTTAVLDSRITVNEKLVAKAQGTYSIFPRPEGMWKPEKRN